MEKAWKEEILSADSCSRCEKTLVPSDQMILSVYDHKVICMECKGKEEHASNYSTFSKKMIGQCMLDSELTMVDPGDYCYHHFYPYSCQ